MKVNVTVFAIAAGLFLSGAAFAPSFPIDWYQLAGGGGTNRSGDYEVNDRTLTAGVILASAMNGLTRPRAWCWHS